MTRTERVENEVMDVLMEGPGSIKQVALETGLNQETTRRVIRNLCEKGLVEEYGKIQAQQGAPTVHYQMKRTKAAA